MNKFAYHDEIVGLASLLEETRVNVDSFLLEFIIKLLKCHEEIIEVQFGLRNSKVKTFRNDFLFFVRDETIREIENHVVRVD